MSETWTPEILERFRKAEAKAKYKETKDVLREIAPEAFEEEWINEAEIFIGKISGDPYLKIAANMLLTLPGFVKVPHDSRVKNNPMRSGSITLTVTSGKITKTEVKET